MKISIITVQKAPNFGAVLQCYALYKYLSKSGHDTDVIDLLRPVHHGFIYTKGFEPLRKKKESLFKKTIKSAKKNVKNIRSIFIPKYKKQKEFLLQINNSFLELEDLIRYTKTYHSISELIENPPSADLYITGSDQLWNPTQQYALEPFFLNFVKSGKKMSYATSIGLSDLTKDEKSKFANWLSTYYAISVREVSAKKILQPLVKQNIEIVCDPTMLLSREEWGDLSVKPDCEPESYLFLFLLYYNQELYDYAKKVAKEKCLDLKIWTNTPKLLIKDSNVVKGISPQEWLGLIANAKIILTNSFHGCVFSMIFNKSFGVHISKDNKRGCRIENLLELYNLSNCLLKSDEMHRDRISFLDEIDFLTLNNKINEERKKSINFINRILNSVD